MSDKQFFEYEIYENYPKLNKNDYELEQVDLVDLTWFINKKNFDKNDYFDENFFLYFEAYDFAKRLTKKNKKIFISKKIDDSYKSKGVLKNYDIFDLALNYG